MHGNILYFHNINAIIWHKNGSWIDLKLDIWLYYLSSKYPTLTEKPKRNTRDTDGKGNNKEIYKINPKPNTKN